MSEVYTKGLFDDILENWRDKKLKYPNRLIRLGTCFSGIGAPEQALSRLNLNYKIVFAGDIDKKVKESYFANYSITEKQWHTDIQNFNAEKYKNNVDILIGGSPCQAFSTAGKQLGFEDTRGTLFYEYARIIKECQPKVFIYENVRGLINHDKGKTWSVIKSVFEELGYDIHYEVLNSKDYGIPQNRRRLFCVGFKNKTNFLFPKPIPLNYTMFDFLEDYTDSKYFLKNKGIKFISDKSSSPTEDGEFDFIFKIKDVDEKYYISEKSKKYILCNGTKTYNAKAETDLPIARTLLSTMHKMHRAGIDNYVSHTGRLRRLTPRECLRLMGFRDNFKIVVSDTSSYQQSGNSIVVDVLMAILKQMDITEFGIEC